MAPLRILFLAYYFPPLGGMGSLRALGMARHLPAFGAEVLVVAPRAGTYAEDPTLAVPPDLRVERTPTLEPGVLLRAIRGDRGRGIVAPVATGRLSGRAKGLLQRLLHVPDANVGWVPPAVRAALRAGREFRPDLVLASAPPLSALLAARLAARRLGAPLVADFRDFPAAQRLFDGARERVDRWLLRWALDGVAGFVAASSGILEDLRRRRGAPGVLCRNGYDEEDFAGPPPPLPPSRPLRLTHVGSTYADRGDPRPLLGAVRDAAAEGIDVRLRFLGRPDGDLQRAVRECGVEDRVELRGFGSHREAVAAMRSAGALLFFMWEPRSRGAEGQVLGKTFEYLRSGRPVLALCPERGENARLLRELGGAIVRGRFDREGILSALRELWEGRLPPPADPRALLPHTRREQARRLAEWFGGLVGSRE